MKNHTVGILTWRSGTKFAEPAFFRRLIKEGKELGATVFLFSPDDVFEAKRQIRGVTLSSDGAWTSKWFSWPDIVIDRYRYYPKPKHKNYLAFRKRPLFNYANSRFSSKWNVYQVLVQDESMRRWLPETAEFSKEHLLEMIDKYPVVYVKPNNGTGGRSIVRIKKVNGRYHLMGRSKHDNTKVVTQVTGKTQLFKWMERWIENEKLENEFFLVQQGLDLNLVPDRTVDMRLLIQKDEFGVWKITGVGVRVGGEKSSTSNLHGGGKAVDALSFLTPRFGTEKTKEILQDCCQLAYRLVHVVENHYGRMIEFGLDIGIDVNGKVWLIEQNPKPGREIFKGLKQPARYKQAVKRPLQYALYLLQTQRSENASSS